MTWEQAISHIRNQPSYSELVEKAYLDENLILNVERFMSSEEFQETLKTIRGALPKGNNLLDIGSGNGISAIAFALNGFKVTAIEPDSSDTVGAGAIRKLKAHYNIDNLSVVESFAEDLHIEGVSFDVIYARQCLHHAYDLPKFLKVLGNLAKPGAIFLSTRDHVIYNAEDKQFFLDSHPLQKFYGGENAFTLDQYKAAIEGGGFTIVKQFGHFESVINYYPMTRAEVKQNTEKKEKQLIENLKAKIGWLSSLSVIQFLYKKYHRFDASKVHNEKHIPGRLYTFLARKNS